MTESQTLTTLPYVPAEAREFLDYMQGAIPQISKLQSDGRVPDDEGVESLLTFWRRIIAQVRTDVNKAGSNASPITSSLPMTRNDYQRTWAMFDTFYPLLEILELRGVIDMRRSDAVNRVIDALYGATLE
ncbi:MAG TPA: hypothetical protein VG899_03285 [Mycobacteriales bacterium]|nr:hypothetical protein [Mycobacteriales bacterium]HWA65376.1 hypothetical protein [Mycobacteriales bacterium]